MSKENMAVIIMIAICILIGIGLLRLVNLKKDQRYRQGWIPFAAAFFSVAAFMLGMYFKKKIVAMFAGTFIYNFLNSLASIRWAILFNAAILVAYFIFKIVLIFMLKVFFKNFNGPSFNEKFYVYLQDYNNHFLKDEWVNIRKIFNVMTFMYGAYLGFYVYHLGIRPEGKNLSAFILPAIVLIVTNEIYNYLNGYTKEEYKLIVGGDDSLGQSVNNYYKLREIYEALFPGELLSAHTSCEFASRQSVLDFIKELEKSEDDMDQIVAEFFRIEDSSKNRKRFDVDMIQAVRDLLHKNNVVIFDPFYRDLDRYLILPVVDALISDKKVLVITARNSSKQEIINWMEVMIKDYCKFESLWRVGDLAKAENGLEVGVAGFNELYDNHMIDSKNEFFDSVGFVLLMEPSLVVNTGQLGFSVVADLIRENGMEPVYCILDRMTDGLVDTMSHLLRSRIVHVVAPPIPRRVHTGMSWDADGDYKRQSLFDKQTRFLGRGLELSAVAIKNQIPKVSWVSESRSPIRDIKWIVGQYYTTLCRYMNLPVQQQSIYDKIDFVSGLWSLERKTNTFLVVEDEFNNIFATIQAFLSRGEEQTFVNVMGENYLLRDYMRCNPMIFRTNPNAVPSIVADFARTQRNTLLKILFIMTYRQMSETEIREELELIDYPSSDVLAALTDLTRMYTFAQENIFEITATKNDRDLTGMRTEYHYSVPMEKYDRYLSRTLKNAYFVVENEHRKTEYIDARLFSQVGQILLPGQFTVYDGKYYQVKHISLENGVELRRASDLYVSNKYYRQKRIYYMDSIYEDEPVSKRLIMDVETTVVKADFHVKTTGYLEMESVNDLRKAREIHIPLEKTVEELTRSYHNKNILKVYLPETSQGERFTLCLLLSEMFRSIFPNTWPYLAVTTILPSNIEGMLNETLYKLEGSVKEEYIYIIEDSDIDLGLLETIDKNFLRFMEILYDYVDWHFEKMRETAYRDPVATSVVLPPDQEVKRRTGIGRLLERIARIFGFKKKEEEDSVPAAQEPGTEDPDSQAQDGQPAAEGQEPVKTQDDEEEVLGGDQAGDSTDADLPTPLPEAEVSTEDEEAEDQEETAEEESQGEDHPVNGDDGDEIGDVDGTDIFTEEEDPIHEDYFDEHFEALGIGHREPTRYQKECYLKYHFDKIDDRLELNALRRYLNARGLGNSDLTKARKRDVLEDSLLYMKMENCCDFCGMPISGVSYEILNDGRTRCNDCASTAINTVEEFRDIFFHTKLLMEGFFNINYKVSIRVETADAAKINRGVGMIFRPSTEFAARTLGYAQYYRGRYSLLVENGSPRLATIGTMVHEMTHIWQYLNWNSADIIRIYGNGTNRQIVYEGMAMWAQIQYLYLIGETYYAMREEEMTAAREDIYGVGFNLYRQKYPISRDTTSIRISPFQVYPPL